MRVLVAFEDVRSAYRDIIARAVRASRPALEVRSAALAEIERELRRFDPHVVVCSRPNGEHPGGRGAYRDIIARAVRALRPALEVRSAALAEIERELRRFDPHVVVCSRPNGEHPGGRGAWVHVPTEDGATDDERLARVCLEGERWRTDGPPLAELLEIVDRTEERLREGRLTEAC